MGAASREPYKDEVQLLWAGSAPPPLPVLITTAQVEGRARLREMPSPDFP